MVFHDSILKRIGLRAGMHRKAFEKTIGPSVVFLTFCKYKVIHCKKPLVETISIC